MKTISIRLDDEFFVKIEAKRGDESKSDFYRRILCEYIEKTDEDKVNKDEYGLNKDEYRRLQIELKLKDELLRGKDAHIEDLKIQLGWFHQHALPPATTKAEESDKVKKKRWWEWRKKK